VERILREGVLLARDQNKVFVERADRKPLGPREAEAKYLLKRGKGNAYIEFDAQPAEVQEQSNPRTGQTEMFLAGTVDLGQRNAQGFENS
jgi:hypothetical protein